MEGIKLVPIENNKITIITGIIYSDETLKNTFSLNNLISRQLNSIYAFKIQYKYYVCGFINMVYNRKLNQVEIDIGIKKEYRGIGVGTSALKLLKNFCINNNIFKNIEILVQVQKQNIACIKSLENSGFNKKYKNDNYIYYGLK